MTETQPVIKGETVKVDWGKTNRDTFLDVLLSIQRDGDFPENGFKKCQWTSIERTFEERTHLGYTRCQLQNMYANLKKNF